LRHLGAKYATDRDDTSARWIVADFTQLKSYPGIPVYGGSKQGQAVDTVIKDGETFTIGENIHIK
jgi:hypothetical protein